MLGTAYREGERMLDRMQYLIGGTAELREHGGSLADTLISPCCSTRPRRGGVLLAGQSRRNRPPGFLAARRTRGHIGLGQQKAGSTRTSTRRRARWR